MKVLLTGASSFTGFWFARELSRQGASVTACFTRGPSAYEGVQAERIAQLDGACEFAWQTRFGDPSFVARVGAASWDAVCVHGAYVRDYRSEDFPVAAALEDNTHGLRGVLQAARRAGVGKIVLTGSVFEAGEGMGEAPLRAFSPYGLSKTLTAEVFRFWCDRIGLALAKFVIPNPFGPYEEPRFTQYLVTTWARGETAVVRTPDYVRDNIPVSLLARSYARFVGRTPAAPFESLGPSWYVESQGAFARRFADAMRPRLALACALDLPRQSEFAEPKVRINKDRPDSAELGWVEDAAWDELAAYYRARFAL